VPIAITLNANAAPNTTVSIPGIATVVLNQQTTDSNGVLTVNAVHITLLGGAGANVIVGHAAVRRSPGERTPTRPR
jgi:hypothetical protein